MVRTGCIEDSLGIRGVGIVLNKKFVRTVDGYIQLIGRIILVKLAGIKLNRIVLVQVCIPPLTYQDEVENVYEYILSANAK